MPAMHNSSKPIKYRLETIDAVRDDEKLRGYDRARRAGLSRADELALIDALRSTHPPLR